MAAVTPDGEASTAAATVPPPLESLHADVERALRVAVDAGTAGAPSAAGEAVEYALLGPGKRIRPLLLLAAYRAGGGEPGPDAARLAASVEMVHAYSLVHDDLPCMDDDPLRRGRPALHVHLGEACAVYAGASLMPLAVWTIADAAERLGLERSRTRRLVTILTRASGGGGMVGGQFLDLEAEGRRLGKEELERMYRGKTGALLASAAEMGGVAAGADDDRTARLRRFGESVGLAFQIVDDRLDVTGSAAELGKASGRDRILDKATYPALFGLDEAQRRSRELVEEACRTVSGLPHADDLEVLAGWVVDRRR